MLGDRHREPIANSGLSVCVARIEAVVNHGVDIRGKLILKSRLRPDFFGKHNGVPAGYAIVHARTATGALVNIIHNLVKLDGIAIDEGDTKRSRARGASFVSRRISNGTNVVAHPTKTAGLHVLFCFF